MIEINGIAGGGQILRTAIGLSALTLKPAKIINIRKNKPNPGLRAQHITGVKIAGELCDANVKGLVIGSTEVEFVPKEHNFSNKQIDIGTAGSIGLLLQTLTPLLIFTDKPITLEIIGGTDVKWSPSTTFFYHMLCDYYLKNMGIVMKLETLRHGFYPRGCGRVKVTYEPNGKLKPLEIIERGELKHVNIWSIASEQLKKAKVAERQIESFKKNINERIGEEKVIYSNSLSIGTSLHAHAHYENCKLSAGSLGERGKSSEVVGKEVADELTRSITSGAVLDKYMTDQILPFMALANGRSSILVEKITDHCVTNMKVIETILPVKFVVKDRTISIDGYGFN